MGAYVPIAVKLVIYYILLMQSSELHFKQKIILYIKKYYFVSCIIHFLQVCESSPAQQFFLFIAQEICPLVITFYVGTNISWRSKKLRKDLSHDYSFVLSGFSFIVLDMCVSKKGTRKKNVGPEFTHLWEMGNICFLTSKTNFRDKKGFIVTNKNIVCKWYNKFSQQYIKAKILFFLVFYF